MILPSNVLEDALELSDGMSEFDAKMTPKWEQKAKQSPKDRRLGTVSEYALRWSFGMPQPVKPFDYEKIFKDRHNADVGDNVEVRATDWQSGRLIVRQKHDDVKPRIGRDYCLVVIRPEDWSFRIPGWLPMREIMKIWHTFKAGNRPDAKAVHQQQLKPLVSLTISDGHLKHMFISKHDMRVQGSVQPRLF